MACTTIRLRDDLVSRIQRIPAVRDTTISMYTEREMQNAKRELKLPAVGVFYTGLVPQEKLGRMVEAAFDIIVISKDVRCDYDPLEELLEDIRKEIFCNPKSVIGTSWNFKFEIPRLEDKPPVYVQRWSTNFIIS